LSRSWRTSAVESESIFSLVHCAARLERVMRI